MRGELFSQEHRLLLDAKVESSLSLSVSGLSALSMKNLVALSMLFVCAFASAQTPALFRITDASQRKEHVGQQVELIGIVSDTRCPQLLGVDLWELEDYRGRRVRVVGVLRQFTVTQEQLDEARRTGREVASRGAGTFYRLEDAHFEVQP